MRRMLASLLAVGTLGLLALFAPASASAAPARAAAPQFCDPSDTYPFGPDATVQVDTTQPSVGDKIEVSGIKYCPNEDVDITIAGKHVGTAHTDADGSFDPTVETPGPAGSKQLCGIGASGLSRDADCLTINVGGSSPGAPSGGTPAFTGVEIALLGFVALAAIVGGIVFTTLGRNRRSARV